MWCWKELRKPCKLAWNGHLKPNGITVMLFLFTIPCTMAHLMKCALTNMRLIRSKPSTQICATTWNAWRVNPDVSQEEYNRWLRTCNSLSIVITTDNWPSAASQNMLLTWLTSFVLYLRHSLALIRIVDIYSTQAFAKKRFSPNAPMYLFKSEHIVMIQSSIKSCRVRHNHIIWI